MDKTETRLGPRMPMPTFEYHKSIYCLKISVTFNNKF